ncbi:hypothetical protein GKZ89_03560 [Bacillus mangrovi]|uniref:Uncharacterized protein n=1 Tax=Metabacillus mangrovi TaxID=1491830 RepID=A0A7X2S2G2_9BACI|nr:hypothetical protein [Metabacillus mangrovi]MTH52472.1 hypothetical protein [Metabacillus mangrovi]
MDGLQSLIDAVISNPILSGVLIWIGSVFFSRLFKNKEDNPEIKQERRQQREKEAQQSVRQAEETVQSAYERVQQEYGNRIRSGIKEPEIEKIGERKNMGGIRKTSRQKQALQGIVWSEIIGKPRAVNPHHTRHRRIRP